MTGLQNFRAEGALTPSANTRHSRLKRECPVTHCWGSTSARCDCCANAPLACAARKPAAKPQFRLSNRSDVDSRVMETRSDPPTVLEEVDCAGTPRLCCERWCWQRPLGPPPAPQDHGGSSPRNQKKNYRSAFLSFDMIRMLQRRRSPAMSGSRHGSTRLGAARASPATARAQPPPANRALDRAHAASGCALGRASSTFVGFHLDLSQN